MCKPVLPLVQDEIAHFLWNEEHHATVHLHNGEHHAEEEMAESSNGEEGKTPATPKNLEPVSIHIALQNSYSIPQVFLEKQNFYCVIERYASWLSAKDYPPPKSS